MKKNYLHAISVFFCQAFSLIYFQHFDLFNIYHVISCRTHTHTHTRVCVCVCVCMYVCMYIYIYIYIYMQLHKTSGESSDWGLFVFL